MKTNLHKITAAATLFLLPLVSNAQLATSGNAGPFQDFLINILIFINQVLIPFIIGIGFLFFVWGMFLYFIMGGADEEKKLKGRMLMVNGTIGFVVIIIFFGVINLLTGSTGLEGEALDDIPSVFIP
jgi:hypothetical protein